MCRGERQSLIPDFTLHAFARPPIANRPTSQSSAASGRPQGGRESAAAPCSATDSCWPAGPTLSDDDYEAEDKKSQTNSEKGALAGGADGYEGRAQGNEDDSESPRPLHGAPA